MSLQFSDTSNKLGIIQACESYCGLGDTGISGDSLLLKEFTRHINEANSRVWHMIFSSYGGWQFEDSNQSDLPAATITLTANQTSYPLPDNAITVRGIEVKDAGGVWSELKPITEEMIRDSQPMGEFYKTAGSPMYYQLVGQSVRIFPASDYTQAASFKVFYDRAMVAFASTDTSATPGFAGNYHGILPILASIQFLLYRKPDSATLPQLRNEAVVYENNLKQFYQAKWSQMFPPRIRTADIIREYA